MGKTLRSPDGFCDTGRQSRLLEEAMAGSGRSCSGSWASACGLVVAACLLPHPTAAQSFPTRAITWVVPSSAGGVTDVSSRVIAKPLAAILGVPVIVDPRPGAGGIIATEFVANAKPDGYTILLATSGTIATNPWLYKKLTYDPIKSFKPVWPCAPITTRSGWSARAARTISARGLRPWTTLKSASRPVAFREFAMSSKYC